MDDFYVEIKLINSLITKRSFARYLNIKYLPRCVSSLTPINIKVCSKAFSNYLTILAISLLRIECAVYCSGPSQVVPHLHSRVLHLALKLKRNELHRNEGEHFGACLSAVNTDEGSELQTHSQDCSGELLAKIHELLIIENAGCKLGWGR